ncbi:hypothetical protein [Vibrio mediterranei]|uniref:hypothetical protein n=1 Tax=Vibrio mediterranei TaxID=689 RepID=UPI00148C20F1|nr:hypothetical protein [Vibrio mediterranei]NOI26266.1 hypothetical protein [Vibrio mediterranei]
MALAACGSDSGGSNSSGVVTQTGQFNDAAVAGIKYVASPSGLSGITNSHGNFKYQAGDKVTFSLGGLDLEVPKEKIAVTGNITPFDISGIEANKVAALLQTLDTDGNSTNGLNMPTEEELSAIDIPTSISGITDAELENVHAELIKKHPKAKVVKLAASLTHLKATLASHLDGVWEYAGDNASNAVQSLVFNSKTGEYTYLNITQANAFNNVNTGQELGAFAIKDNGSIYLNHTVGNDFNGINKGFPEDPSFLTIDHAYFNDDLTQLTLDAAGEKVVYKKGTASSTKLSGLYSSVTGERFVFVNNHIFIFADGSDSLEYGSYTYNETTGATVMTFTYDLDGATGLSDAMNGYPLTGKLPTANKVNATITKKGRNLELKVGNDTHILSKEVANGGYVFFQNFAITKPGLITNDVTRFYSNNQDITNAAVWDGVHFGSYNQTLFSHLPGNGVKVEFGIDEGQFGICNTSGGSPTLAQLTGANAPLLKPTKDWIIIANGGRTQATGGCGKLADFELHAFEIEPFNTPDQVQNYIAHVSNLAKSAQFDVYKTSNASPTVIGDFELVTEDLAYGEISDPVQTTNDGTEYIYVVNKDGSPLVSSDVDKQFAVQPTIEQEPILLWSIMDSHPSATRGTSEVNFYPDPTGKY